jgi:DNA adenine methylase
LPPPPPQWQPALADASASASMATTARHAPDRMPGSYHARLAAPGHLGYRGSSKMVARMEAKPFVKWAGGKSRLLGELAQRVPTAMGTYAEPFAGGAALFFAVASDVAKGKRSFERAVLADRNEELVVCYRAVRDDVEGVLRALGGYRYDRDIYYATRDQDTRGMATAERAARLIFLNRTCFNGLWRVNGSGKFNVPFGRYKNPRIVDEEGLRAASAFLHDVAIETVDFLEVTRALGPGDFVYLDPPYVPLSKTASFTAYSADGFRPADQARLAEELRSLRDRGVLAMLSNADTPETRKLYADFAVTVVHAPRAINSDATKRGQTPELLVVTWGPTGLHEERASVQARGLEL